METRSYKRGPEKRGKVRGGLRGGGPLLKKQKKRSKKEDFTQPKPEESKKIGQVPKKRANRGKRVYTWGGAPVPQYRTEVSKTNEETDQGRPR